MHPDLHAKLITLDSDEHWESPPSFDYFRALGEVFYYQAYIENILKRKLSIDRNVQDASFFTELADYDPRYYDTQRGGALVQMFAIRFSAFDRMFTIFGTEEESTRDKIPDIVKFLTERKFNYVAHADLMENYDGKHTFGTDGWTWFTRFFDYL